MIRKAIKALSAVLIFGSVSLWLYIIVTTMSEFETLLLCSQGKVNSVPKKICQAYLSNSHIAPSEIESLNAGIGVSWALFAEEQADRIALLNILISKGVDINAIDPRTGLTSLHSAVLLRDVHAVLLLTRAGADKNIKGIKNGMSALEMAKWIDGRNASPELKEIISILE